MNTWLTTEWFGAMLPLPIPGTFRMYF